jgi:hypothetical protein
MIRQQHDHILLARRSERANNRHFNRELLLQNMAFAKSINFPKTDNSYVRRNIPCEKGWKKNHCEAG